MKPVGFLSVTRGPLGWPFCALTVMLSVLAVAALGAPPIDPLPEPLFSFGAGSPTVLEEVVGANGMLGLDLPNLETRFHGWAFGLGLCTDDLDAHSVGNEGFPPDAPFALLQVDRIRRKIPMDHSVTPSVKVQPFLSNRR